MVSSVEAFPSATMDVILDVRRQLRAPLIRFRAALVAASEELAANPLDPDAFRLETQSIWHRVVQPALQELDEMASDLKLRATLRRDLPAGVAVSGDLGG